MPKGKTKPKAKAKKHARNSAARTMRNNRADDGDRRRRTSSSNTVHTTSPSSRAQEANKIDPAAGDDTLSADAADKALSAPGEHPLSSSDHVKAVQLEPPTSPTTGTTPPGGSSSVSAHVPPSSVVLESQDAHSAPRQPPLSSTDDGVNPTELEPSTCPTSPTLVSTPVGCTPPTSPTVDATPTGDCPSVSAQAPPTPMDLSELLEQGLDSLQRIQSDRDRALRGRKRAHYAFKWAVTKANSGVTDRSVIAEGRICVAEDLIRACDDHMRTIEDHTHTVKKWLRIVDRYVYSVNNYERGVEDYALASAEYIHAVDNPDTAQNGGSDPIDVLLTRLALAQARKRSIVDQHSAEKGELRMLVAVFQRTMHVGKRALDIHKEAERIFVVTQGVLSILGERAEAG